MRLSVVFSSFLFFTMMAPFTYGDDKCRELKKFSDDMNKQTPVTIDYTTVLTGMTIARSGTHCLAAFSYTVDEKKFLPAISKSNGLSIYESKIFLQSAEGQSGLYQLLRNQLLAMPLAKDKDVKITAIYTFSGDLPTLVVNE